MPSLQHLVSSVGGVFLVVFWYVYTAHQGVEVTVVVGFSRTDDGHNHRQGATSCTEPSHAVDDLWPQDCKIACTEQVPAMVESEGRPVCRTTTQVPASDKVLSRDNEDH